MIEGWATASVYSPLDCLSHLLEIRQKVCSAQCRLLCFTEIVHPGTGLPPCQLQGSQNIHHVQRDELPAKPLRALQMMIEAMLERERAAEAAEAGGADARQRGSDVRQHTRRMAGAGGGQGFGLVMVGAAC